MLGGPLHLVQREHLSTTFQPFPTKMDREEIDVLDVSDQRVTTNEETTQLGHNLNSTSLHSIDEITWLNSTEPTITLNATNSVYQVLLNTVS